MSQTVFSAAIQQARPAMTALRQHLHAHPELGYAEWQTSALIASSLEQWGYQVERGLAGTGIVATLKQGDGSKVLGLRADMDALPIQEEADRPHASRQPGVMHACGHDGHCAALLAAARLLAAPDSFNGTLRLIFQPAEECQQSGAKAMLEQGLFQRFPCDAIFALHNWPGIPVGQFGLLAGPLMASTDTVHIRIHGHGGHGAMPHQAVDPILVGAALTLALQSIVARNVDPLDVAVVTVGAVHAGSLSSVIPDLLDMALTVRALRPQVRELLLERIRQLTLQQAASFGASAEITVDPCHFPVLVNDAEHTAFARQVVLDWLGEQGLYASVKAQTGSEDFAFMLQHCPGCYLLLGNGPLEGGCMLHNPAYDFNDQALPYAAEYWQRLAMAYLR
ncbi:M20 aminoacylase family protein [Aquitalea aquatica]|nr:M20 aminoacylase family protein [Aquitalea magnusonii]